jgi:TPP-dependent pyruvate/acetoin dehydrogenase alpha subunit
MLEQITAEARTEMEAAVKFAVASPYPSVDQVEQDVYAREAYA